MNRREQIIQMINYKSTEEMQRKGVKMALSEVDLDFIMYYSSDPTYADNCAKIFTSLPYDKCEKYFDDLFSWIEDLNQPGAQEILEYLAAAPAELMLNSFCISLEASIKRKNKMMAEGLLMIISENKQLEMLVKNDDRLSKWLNEAEMLTRETWDGGLSSLS